MALAAPPVSTGRGRRGEVTGADPSGSSGGGFRRLFLLASRSMRSTNDRPDSDSAGSAWYRSQTAATTMAATPATNGRHDKFVHDTSPPWTHRKWPHTYTTDDYKT
jgi:hypothetical protein